MAAPICSDHERRIGYGRRRMQQGVLCALNAFPHVASAEEPPALARRTTSVVNLRREPDSGTIFVARSL
jgi:hypothetical protein